MEFILTKKEMNILLDVEDLLHDKLLETNGIKDTYNGKEYTYFDENDEEHNIWIRYNTLIETLIQRKNKMEKLLDKGVE